MKYAEPDRWKELKRLYRENSVDKTVKSDIIDIKIDEFVPCLKKAKTGEILSTEVSMIKRSELYKYNSRNGWNDEWKNRPINEEVFGAKHILIVHEYQFLIEGEASQRLLDIYNYERRG